MTTWEPEKGNGARLAQQQAREARTQKMLERRQARGKQHRIENMGSCNVCHKCNRRAFTAKGLQQLRLMQCDGNEQRQQQKQADRAQRLQSKKLKVDLELLAAGTIEPEALGEVPAAGAAITHWHR